MINVNVMLSCDDNPYYSDFWPFVRSLWVRRFGIKPKLIYISDDPPPSIPWEEDTLHVKKIQNVPIHLQAQLARIYFAKEFPDDICVLSDIDMFPVSKKFFNKRNIVKFCDRDTFYHLNPEVREFGQLPICYYCGYGSLYDKLVDGLSWEEFLNMVIEKDFNTDNFDFQLPSHLQDKKLWFSDEIFIYNQILEKNINIEKSENLIGHGRMDREIILDTDNLSSIYNCVDIHLPRPYSEHRSSIDSVYYSLIL
jgi:hypothetical protein